MTANALIIIGPDGTVLAAQGDLPPRLVDIDLTRCDSLPPSVREAATALVHELRASDLRMAARTVVLDSSRSVQVIGVEAMAVRRTSVDLRALLPSKLAVLSSQAATANVNLTVDVADDVPAAVRVDADKLAWAVTTLVGNALRYVQTGSRRLRGGVIAVKARVDRAQSAVVIDVHDDGPGVQADTIARLFKRDGLNVRGSGLALLLVSDVMAAHAGKVSLESSTEPESHGTTVRLTFPAG